MLSSFTFFWHNMSWILWFDDFNLFILSLKQFGSDGLLKKSSFSLIGDRNTFIWAAAKESGFGLTVFIHSSLQNLIGYRNGGKIRVFISVLFLVLSPFSSSPVFMKFTHPGLLKLNQLVDGTD